MISQILTMMIFVVLFDAFHHKGFTNKFIRKMATIATQLVLDYGRFAVAIGCVIAIWFARDFVRDEWRALSDRRKIS